MAETPPRTPLWLTALALILTAAPAMPASAGTDTANPTEAEAASADTLARLVDAYPDALDRIEGDALYWRDGSRMALDDGGGPKPFAAWLAAPDIEDTLRIPYPAGRGALEPAPESGSEFFVVEPAPPQRTPSQHVVSG